MEKNLAAPIGRRNHHNPTIKEMKHKVFPSHVGSMIVNPQEMGPIKSTKKNKTITNKAKDSMNLSRNFSIQS